MTNKQTQSDVIIIGGGIAGLTAAIYLARAGRSVTVFEKSPRFGGRAETQIKDGFHFNLGPHALYRLGAGVRILRELGVEFTGTPPRAGGFAVREGRKYGFPRNPLALLSTRLLSLPGKFVTAQLLTKLSKIDTEPLQHITVREWLDNNIRQPDVRQLFQAIFRLTTYANEIDHQSAGAVIDQFQLGLAGNVLYLDNGWQTLIDELLRVASDFGVKIISNTKITGVKWDESAGVRGVRLTDGTLQAASTVLIAASPSVVCQLVDQSESTILHAWAAAARPVRAACLDIGLRTVSQPKATFALGIDRPLYLSVHSAVAALAPNNGALIHVAKYLPSGNTEACTDRAELEALLDLIQPGWRDVVIESRFLPNMTVSNAVITAAQGGTAGRPGPNVPGIAGLYLAGDWVGSTGMLADASFASAKQATEMILAAGNKRNALTKFRQTKAIVGANSPVEHHVVTV